MDPQINKSFSTELALGVDQHERPTSAVGQMSKRCVAASPKLPFNTLCSIFVGRMAALQTKLPSRSID
jgi:hypothetical protein